MSCLITVFRVKECLCVVCDYSVSVKPAMDVLLYSIYYCPSKLHKMALPFCLWFIVSVSRQHTCRKSCSFPKNRLGQLVYTVLVEERSFDASFDASHQRTIKWWRILQQHPSTDSLWCRMLSGNDFHCYFDRGMSPRGNTGNHVGQDLPITLLKIAPIYIAIYPQKGKNGSFRLTHIYIYHIM